MTATYPEFYVQADQHSVKWQRWYLWTERIQLGALIAPAAMSVFGRPPMLLVAIALVMAMASHLWRRLSRADEKWWNGRAGAESAKTLTWRYIAGGLPFAISTKDADATFAQRIRDIASDVARLEPVSASAAVITSDMRELRCMSLDERVRLYLNERINEQLKWYAEKSRFNTQKSTRWSVVTMVAQTLALLYAIIAAVQHWEMNLVAALSAVAAVSVAWSAIKQFDVLGRSYAVASQELSMIATRIESDVWNEESWPSFVDEAEEAISREHTSWRASRAV
jgi:ABC-type multidrug transport system fused ATPase/permease subunit